jgi:hypothetical protein
MLEDSSVTCGSLQKSSVPNEWMLGEVSEEGRGKEDEMLLLESGAEIFRRCRVAFSTYAYSRAKASLLHFSLLH